MKNVNKMAAKATTTAQSAEMRRHELIRAGAMRHAAVEMESNEAVAIEIAVADMIGASQFLQARLGRRRAREIVNRLLNSL